MLKEIYFGVQIALLILSGSVASDMCYRGELKGIYAAVIIIACLMALYSSMAFFIRSENHSEGNKRATIFSKLA